MTKTLSIDEKLHHIEHLLEVMLKNQEQIKVHVWTDENGLDKIEEPKEHIKYQEEQAEEYFLSVIKPKLEAREAGEMEVAGFWDGAVLNYLKQQALNFVGHILKKIVLQGAVDFAKWLADQAEEQIIKLYQNASDEDKETFKEKIQENFPDSELLKKLA